MKLLHTFAEPQHDTVDFSEFYSSCLKHRTTSVEGLLRQPKHRNVLTVKGKQMPTRMMVRASTHTFPTQTDEIKARKMKSRLTGTRAERAGGASRRCCGGGGKSGRAGV